MMRKFGLFFSIALLALLGCENGNMQVTQVETTKAVSEDSSHAAVEFTSAGFEADVLESSQVVLVDCWAPW